MCVFYQDDTSDCVTAPGPTPDWNQPPTYSNGNLCIHHVNSPSTCAPISHYQPNIFREWIGSDGRVCIWFEDGHYQCVIGG